MRRRGLRRETAELDKKIWDWSLSQSSVTKTKIQNYAKSLFSEAGFESFKASDCWYRRWRGRWRNAPDKPEVTPSNSTEIEQFSSEDKNKKQNLTYKRRKNSKNNKDSINIESPSKKTNLIVDSDEKSDNFQVLSETSDQRTDNFDVLSKTSDQRIDNFQVLCKTSDQKSDNQVLSETSDQRCSNLQVLSGTNNFEKRTNEKNTKIQKQSDQKLMENSDKILQNNSTVVQNSYGIFSGIEFSDISAQIGRLNSTNCTEIKINEVNFSGDATSSTLMQKDGIRDRVAQINEENNCSLAQTSRSYSVKTHTSEAASSSSPDNIIDTVTQEEIDCSLDQIGDDYCFKTQTFTPCLQTTENNVNILGINVMNCGSGQGERSSVESCLEKNLKNVNLLSNNVGDNMSMVQSNNYACRSPQVESNSTVQNNVFSCTSRQVETVSNNNDTSQIENSGKNFCITENATQKIQFENFVEISNDSVFPNFSVTNFGETSRAAERCNKVVTNLKSVENFVEISNDSDFPNFRVINFEETTNRSNEIVTELKSVGLDLCSRDQHSLELMKVINSNFNRNSESSISSDNLDTCLMSGEFQIPGLSLGSDEIFENYRNSLFMESNYMFCESCDDFHINEADDCEALCEEITSLSPEIHQQSVEQDILDKNVEPTDKEKNKDGDGSGGLKTSIQRERKKGERYLPKFKAKVVAYTKSHTIRATALKFNVNECTVSEWIQAKLRRNKKQDFEPYKESTSINVEQQFLNWLKSMRETQRPLNQHLISEKLGNLIKPEENSEKRVDKWLEHYLERLKNEDTTKVTTEVSKNKKVSKKYVMYSLLFKKEVALYAEKYSQKSAARDFGVPRKRVYEWVLAVKDSQGQDGSAMLEKRDCSKYVVDPAIDKNIFDWYKAQSVPPTCKQVREMGLKLYADEGYDVTCSYGWWRRWRARYDVTTKAMTSLDHHILEWVLGQLDRNVKVSHADLIDHVSKIGGVKKASSKVSSGWVIRFCKRYTMLLQRTPQYDTNLPPAMELKVVLFRKRIQKLIDEFELTENDIGTIDEVPIRFTDTGVKIKEQLIRKAGFENCQATLIISCLASGKLLPTIVIVKGGLSQNLALSNEDVMVFIRENGCLDSDILLHWIKNIWLQSQTQKTSILLSNHFQPYNDATVSKELTAKSCKHEFFPAGCLSKLQPIRVSLSRAFQDGLYELWKDRVKTTSWGDEISTMNLPSHNDIFEWTTQIHRRLDTNFQEEIKTSFNKTLFDKYENRFVQDEVLQNTAKTNQEM